MEYTLRDLQAPDLFLVTKIIKKIGLKEIKSCYFDNENVKKLADEMKIALKDLKNDKDKAKRELITNDFTEKIGVELVFDIANIVLNNLDKCEDDIYNLANKLTNIDTRKLGLVEFTELIIEIIKKKEFKDFIKVVSKSFK